MRVTYLTPEGYQRLKKELEFLKRVKRKEVAERLREALSEGGELFENTEYEAAKMEQAFIEGRIQELEHLLATAKVIYPSSNKSGVVDLGSKVTIQEEGFPPETYTIVGPVEADPEKGYISYESPLGKALMGKKAGDEVVVHAPDGTFRVRILKVE